MKMITQRRKDAKELTSDRPLSSDSNCGFAPLRAILLCLTVMLCAGCANLPAPKSVAALIAKQAVVAVAQHYGGDQAGALASAGLSAAAEVMQGYVDKKPPLQVAAASPGVTGVGKVVVNYLVDRGYVSQKVVDQLHDAALIAANATGKK